jgi:hypothetical protein
LVKEGTGYCLSHILATLFHAISQYYFRLNTWQLTQQLFLAVSNCSTWRRPRPSRQVLPDTELSSIVHGQSCISFVTVFCLYSSLLIRKCCCILPGHRGVSACRAVSPVSSSLSSSGYSEVVFMVFGTKFLIARYTPDAWRMRARPKKV